MFEFKEKVDRRVVNINFYFPFLANPITLELLGRMFVCLICLYKKCLDTLTTLFEIQNLSKITVK